MSLLQYLFAQVLNFVYDARVKHAMLNLRALFHSWQEYGEVVYLTQAAWCNTADAIGRITIDEGDVGIPGIQAKTRFAGCRIDLYSVLSYWIKFTLRRGISSAEVRISDNKSLDVELLMGQVSKFERSRKRWKEIHINHLSSTINRRRNEFQLSSGWVRW